MAEILNVNWNSVFENMHNILPQENDSEFSIGKKCPRYASPGDLSSFLFQQKVQ
jgi:hypothetical protein